MSEKTSREYKAIIWTRDPTRPGQRVSIWATSLEEAHRLLEEGHGKDIVFTLYNEENDKTPR